MPEQDPHHHAEPGTAAEAPHGPDARGSTAQDRIETLERIDDRTPTPDATVPAKLDRAPIPPTPPRGPLPLRRSDQIVFGVACSVALLLIGIYCYRTSGWGRQPIELERQPERVLDYKIELNSATWVEWDQMPGIGPVLAHRIVEEREKNGPFRSIDDLHRVKGIGPKKIDALRPLVKVDAIESPDKPAAEKSFDSTDER